MRKANANASHMLEGLFHAPPTDNLVLQALGLIEQAHQAGLELIGQKFLGWADVNDRRWTLIKPGPDNVEHAVGLARLRRGHGHDAAITTPMNRR